MKLDVDNGSNYGIPDEYVQSVSSQLGSLMQLFGLRHIRSRIDNTPVLSVSVMTDAKMFDFAGDSMTPFAMTVANHIAAIASSVGIFGLTLNDVSSDESLSLSGVWKKLPLKSDTKKEVVATGAVPDMKPVEIDL